MPGDLNVQVIANRTSMRSAVTAHCLIRGESGSVKISEKQTQAVCRPLNFSVADFRARVSALLEAGMASQTQEERFFELARVAEARKPQYLLFENVPGLLNHDGGRTFEAILNALDRLGYGVEWQVLNSKDFGVPQSRRRVYIVGYLNANCAGKILPFRETNDAAPAALRDGAQGNRVYDPAGVSCTLSASCGGFGGRTGLYDVSGGVPIKEATKKGYKMAYPGDSIDLAYPQMNTRRGRVGRQIAHTLTTDATQGTLTFIDLNADPRQTKLARCINTRQDAGIHKHRGECSGVLDGKRIRRLTPRECLRLQGWRDDRIDRMLAIQSDNQVYRQAGNGVTVTVVEAIGRRLAAVHKELEE